MANMLEITYVRSVVGRSERQRRTLASLGLRKLHQTVRRPDNPSVRGMVQTLHHLLEWREVDEGTTP